MVETALYNRLEEYNQTISNNYKSNWGSLLNFLDGKDTQVLTEKALQEQQELQKRTEIVNSMKPHGSSRGKYVRESRSLNVTGHGKHGNITRAYRNRLQKGFSGKETLEH